MMIKNLALSILVAGSLMFGTTAMPQKAEASMVGFVCTQSTPLNMRSGPRYSSKVMMAIPRYATVVMHSYEYNSSGLWIYLTYNGISGWVNGEYVCAY